MLMRVSVGIHKEDIDRVISTYNLMSQRFFTHASPTLFNAGTPRPQLSSCFLIAMKDDSIEGIYDTLKVPRLCHVRVLGEVGSLLFRSIFKPPRSTRCQKHVKAIILFVLRANLWTVAPTYAHCDTQSGIMSRPENLFSFAFYSRPENWTRNVFVKKMEVQLPGLGGFRPYPNGLS